ncbi:hypothetical protein KEM54_000775 [Ascosphaera aggregata]|nr:hypothetical protein KEM54_000775 [Ascosphaera aggregata]
MSWEDWYEGCMSLQGLRLLSCCNLQVDDDTDNDQLNVEQLLGLCKVNENDLSRLGSDAVKTVLLPSTHQSSWRYFFLVCASAGAPGTPLNQFILDSYRAAEYLIYIQIPNLASIPVFDALTECLKRDIDVTNVSNKRMMLLEQLVTAGMTTHSWFNRKPLIGLAHDHSNANLEPGNIVGPSSFGSLSIFYWHSAHGLRVVTSQANKY